MAEFNLNNTGLNNEPKKLNPIETELARITPNYSDAPGLSDFVNNPLSKASLLGAGVNIAKTAALKALAGKQTDITQNQVLRESYLGTPVYSSLEFPNGEFNGEEYEGLAIDTVVMKVTQTRNIVENKINGLNGTVKEFINNGDYMIEANGIIVGVSLAPDTGGESGLLGSTRFLPSYDGDIFPYDDAARLRKISELSTSVKIICPFVDEIFGDFEVVIKNLEIRQVEGSGNYYEFKLVMLSDKQNFVLEA